MEPCKFDNRAYPALCTVHIDTDHTAAVCDAGAEVMENIIAAAKEWASWWESVCDIPKSAGPERHLFEQMQLYRKSE